MAYNPNYAEIKAYYKNKHESYEDGSHAKRMFQCNQCGMIFPAFQRHGPINLKNCWPRGIGSTIDSDVCTECGNRVDKALQLIYNENEYVAICPQCLQSHHGLDYFTVKTYLLRLVMRIERIKWRNEYGQT